MVVTISLHVAGEGFAKIFGEGPGHETLATGRLPYGLHSGFFAQFDHQEFARRAGGPWRRWEIVQTSAEAARAKAIVRCRFTALHDGGGSVLAHTVTASARSAAQQPAVKAARMKARQ